MSIINYHNITYPDQNNGDGLRVVLWLSGCSHHCYNCQNPITWDENGGLPFDKDVEEELFRELEKDYISGLTLTGGDPLHENNLDGVLNLVNKIRLLLPSKSIWLYSGYTWNEIWDCNTSGEDLYGKVWYGWTIDRIKRQDIIKQCNVFVDGRYVDSERDITLKWRGSSNQRVINIQESLKQNEIVLWCD